MKNFNRELTSIILKNNLDVINIKTYNMRFYVRMYLIVQVCSSFTLNLNFFAFYKNFGLLNKVWFNSV